MRSAPARYSKAAALGLGLLLIGACGDGSDRAGRTNRTDTAARTAQAPTVDTGTPSTTSAGASAAAGTLTDANIVALLDEANKADSSSGAFAITRATNPEVKAYAKLMMGEHHALRAQGQQLAKKLGVTPQAPANNPLPAAVQAEMTALKAAQKGEQFDRTYIEQEITIHKAVLDLANQAHGAAQNAELKTLIEQARPVIEKHLARAQALQKKLGTTTT